MQQRKFRILLIMTGLAFYCIFPVASAQDFMNFGGKPAAQPQSSSTFIRPGPSGPVSADDFKKMVTSIGQDNQAKLSQQLKQQISTQPKSGPVTPPSSPVPPPETGTAPGTQTTGTSTTTTVTPTAPSTVVATPPPVRTAPPPTTVTNAQPPQQIMPPAPPPTQNQVYTGFGSSAPQTGSTPNRPTQPSSSSGSGWKIKY